MQQQVPNPAEIAKLSVEGQDYQNFESVYVQLHFAEAFDFFRFTAVEPPQVQVGQQCTVELGGTPAITGIVTTRQVAYDGESHAVQLEGKSLTWLPAKSSIVNANTTFDGQGFQDVATKVLQQFNVKATFEGVDNTPYQKLQVEPGENIWVFLERIARWRGIICGADSQGNFKFVGKNNSGSQGSLVEGQNILKMHCIFSIEAIYSIYLVNSQSPGTDGHSGPTASAQTAQQKGSLKFYAPLLTPNEHCAYNQSECQSRVLNESIWNEGSQISAIVTCQGWQSDAGDLWKPGSTVHITSPMCPLDAEMAIQTATFTQDNSSGTLSILECVPPFLLKGQSSFNVNAPNAPVDPQTLTGPPIQPPGGSQ
jgi:prophage tail gpP-like protein